MTTTGSEPTGHDTSKSEFTGVGAVDNQAPAPPFSQLDAVGPGGLRWWRANPEDWMRGRACRPPLTILGVFGEVN